MGETRGARRVGTGVRTGGAPHTRACHATADGRAALLHNVRNVHRDKGPKKACSREAALFPTAPGRERKISHGGGGKRRRRGLGGCAGSAYVQSLAGGVDWTPGALLPPRATRVALRLKGRRRSAGRAAPAGWRESGTRRERVRESSLADPTLASRRLVGVRATGRQGRFAHDGGLTEPEPWKDNLVSDVREKRRGTERGKGGLF